MLEEVCLSIDPFRTFQTTIYFNTLYIICCKNPLQLWIINSTHTVKVIILSRPIVEGWNVFHVCYNNACSFYPYIIHSKHLLMFTDSKDEMRSDFCIIVDTLFWRKCVLIYPLIDFYTIFGIWISNGILIWVYISVNENQFEQKSHS